MTPRTLHSNVPTGGSLDLDEVELAHQWCRAVIDTSYVPSRSTDAPEAFLGLTRDAIDCLFSEEPNMVQAQEIGRSLVRLHLLNPVALGGTLEVLGTRLAERFPPEEAQRLSVRLARLLSRIAQGFYAAANEQVLSEQEQMGRALIDTRLQALNSLRESEERYRRLMDLLPTGVAIAQRGRLLFMNRSALQILGAQQLEEVVGRLVVDFARPEGRAESARRLAEIEAGGAPALFVEESVVRLDGTIVDVEVAATLFQYRGERAVQLVLHDISERKRRGAALRESEAMFRTLAETTNAAIFMYRGSRNIYVNTAAKAITGYNAEELLQKDFWELMHPDHRAMVRERGLGRQCGESTPQRYEVCILTKQGDTRWLDYTGALIQYQGQPTVLGTAFDITASKQAELALRESEEKFRTLAESSPASITILQDGRVVYVNSDQKTITSLTTEEVLDQNPLDWVHPQSRAFAREAWSNLGTGVDVPRSSEVRVRTRDGGSRWVRVYLAPTQYGGRPAWLITALDATAQVEARTRLLDYARRLELLSQIDRASLTGESLAEIARLALELISFLLPCGRASVSRLDDAGGEHLVYQLPDPGDVGSAPEDQSTVAANASADGIENDSSSLSVAMQVKDHRLGYLTLTPRRDRSFSVEDHRIAREVADRLAVAMYNTQLFQEVEAARARLQSLTRRLVSAQEDEQRKIGRELHDDLGQALTALKMNLDLVLSHCDAGATVSAEQAERLLQARGLVGDLTDKVRQLSLRLRPHILEDLGLVPALLWLSSTFRQQTGINVRVEHHLVQQRFQPEVETSVYRIVQEALTNVARHAGADKATVRLWLASQSFYLQIEDSGHGFVVKEELSQPESSGLSGMIERIDSLGGELLIDSAPGQGTCITATLPLPLQAGKER